MTHAGRPLLAALLSCAFALAHAAAPEPPPAPPEDPLLAPFLSPGAYRALSLSPDGRHIAALSFNGYNHAVWLIDAQTLESRLLIQPYVVPRGKYVEHLREPLEISWVANDRLAVNSSDGARLHDLDGKVVQELFARYHRQLRDASGQPTDWLLVQREFDDLKTMSRFNLRTGENFSVDVDVPGRLTHWLSDNAGTVRVATTTDTAFWSDKTRLSTWYRPDGDTAWSKIDERSIVDDPFQPILVSARPGHLAVQARNGGDRAAIWDFDVQRKAFDEPMARHPREDITAVGAEFGGDDFRSVTTDGLKPQTVWFEPHLAQLQATMDANLPDHLNVLLPGGGKRRLVYSYSDVDPGAWYLYDSEAHTLKEIAPQRPSIDPARMQPMRTLTYPSFDGLAIPAYLTLPGKPAGPAPTIVLIHGGPQARDRWQWDRDVQVFAAHGYAVFQPQFRGSTGFGKQFEEAGYGQWGQAMQDDITAGVHWLIDQKIADPKRICIVGGSYGGFAALWGLAKTPELYKCGVSVAGVSDVESMLHDDSDRARSAVQREYMRSRIGDPKLMKATWDSVSPVQHADRIVAPLLIVHGDRDQRVPISHGKQMFERMQRLHKDVQWIEFPEEAHGISGVANLRRWYDATFALFERTIGKGEPPLPPLPAPPPAAASGALASPG